MTFPLSARVVGCGPAQKRGAPRCADADTREDAYAKDVGFPDFYRRHDANAGAAREEPGARLGGGTESRSLLARRGPDRLPLDPPGLGRGDCRAEISATRLARNRRVV